MGLVALHGSSSGTARQPMFEHLAATLAAQGVAVLSYDRRATDDDSDTPLSVQSSDAVLAMRTLHEHLDAPVGVFGFSQGAWAATQAAGHELAYFLMVVGCSGVSPAEQMRFHADEILSRHGYGDLERAKVRSLRSLLEQVLRGDGGRELLDQRLSQVRTESWFPLAYLPPRAPAPGATWPDMDFDPRPAIADVRVPALAFWGEQEDTVPRQESQQVWRDGGNADIVDLPDCGHWPLLGRDRPGSGQWGDDDEPSPDYTRTLSRWVADRLL